MISQNKGKDLHNIPKSRLDTKGPYYCSRKFDGHYVQIKYNPDMGVTFTTSGGKRFYLQDMAEYIVDNFKAPFHIECEYNHNCDGKLGDRGKSAILTTYRTDYNKGITTRGDKEKDIFRVLDLLDMPEHNFTTRLSALADMFYGIAWFSVPQQHLGTLTEGIDASKRYVKEGYEGGMLKHARHMYQPGKRSNDIIKLKQRLTADLTVINYKAGEGKYEGMLGSLLLKDEDGRKVWVGSGLSDADRSCDPIRYIGRVYEIEYERIDTTYIQPIIKHRRKDKEYVN